MKCIRTLSSFILPFLLSLSVYVLTIDPGITLGNSGELVVSAYRLGIPHPPGDPLWTLDPWRLFHKEMLINLTNRLAVKERIETAIRLWNKALEIDPDHTVALNSLGIAYQGKDNLRQAGGYCERSLKVNHHQPHILHNLKQINRFEGRIR